MNLTSKFITVGENVEMLILTLVLSVLGYFFSSKYSDDENNLLLTVKYYFAASFFLISFVAAFTWCKASISELMFYVCLILTIVVYLSLLRSNMKIFYKLSKKGYLILLKIIMMFLTILLTTLFIFWIIVLYGMFIYNNITILSELSESLYEDIPNINSWHDILGKFNYFTWQLNTSKKFLIMGIENLFNPISSNSFETFIQVTNWIYKGGILLDTFHILFDFSKITTYSISNE